MGMLDYDTGEFIELDLGFTPTPTGGGLRLFQQEEVHDGFLLVCGHALSGKSPVGAEATALVTIVGLSQSVFGYPDEEAFWRDGRGELSQGFYELARSKWLENVHEYNRRTAEGRDANLRLRGKYVGARHLFVASRDVSAQFLAQGLRVEVFTDRPPRAVRDEALSRLDTWSQRHGVFSPGDRPVRSYPEGV